VISEKEYGMVRTSLNAEHGNPSTYLDNFLSSNSFNAKYMNMNDKMYDGLLQMARTIKDADTRLKALAECEAYLINKGYVVPFSHGKLSYKVSSINDYSMPRGTYGLARFKLKGVKATENAITTMERNEMKEAYQEAKSSI
jgi:ABC-type oligopeptide transport system substrate-binding subunit